MPAKTTPSASSPSATEPPATSAMEKSSWTLREAIAKALTANSDWAGEKDELLDALYWGRQLLSLAIGLLWGLVPLKGAIAILIYIVASTLAGHCYVTKYQAQDDELYGGFMELAKEGFGAAFATFMVTWITVYSATQF